MKLHPNNIDNDIAIIGLACRFPGAKDYHQYWRNLKSGVNSIGEIPPERWDINKYYSSDKLIPNKSVSKWCGLVEDIDSFDSGFFKISPAEASHMDPQQRLLLEETQHCIEDAGISINILQEKDTAVYIGIMAIDRLKQAVARRSSIDAYSAIGAYPGMIANRVSHIFGFRGPSHAIDAACASSLAAIHNAKRTLVSGESDYALAGGISLNSHPFKYISFSKLNILSPNGQCKTFDKNADGYVPGDGVGVLLLQRLSDAVKEGNYIHGILKGTAVNHHGRSSAFTTPNAKAQYETIKRAYEDAKISPEQVTYIEAHGTGTSLGDPIEVSGLTAVFDKYTNKKEFCKIGSVKTNIGHLEAAAGVAGVIKVLLMMRHNQIPPILNLSSVNPMINFKSSPFIPARELAQWKSKMCHLPLAAGVSSFGLGGVNSHVVLEEYIQNKRFDDKSIDRNIGHPFMLSAKSEKSLSELIDRWKTFSTSREINNYSIGDICATLATGRRSFAFRYGGMLHNKSELSGLLDNVPSRTIAADNLPLPLYIQDIHLSGYHNIRPIFNNNAYLAKYLQRTIETLSKKHCHGELLKGVMRKKWPKRQKRIYSFVIGYACTAALIDAGFIPKFIAGRGTGFWISLALSGIVAPWDVCAYLDQPDKHHDINLSRPVIPIYNPTTRTVLRPFKIGPQYLYSLMDRPKISVQAFNTCINKARQLMKYQFRFKKDMTAWSRLLGSASAIEDMLFNEKPDSENFDSANKDKAFLLLVIICSTRRLNQKWNLTEEKLNIDSKIYELADLVTDGLLTEEDVVGLFKSTHPDITQIAGVINQKQMKLDYPKKPYEHLCKKDRMIHEIGESQAWFKKAVETRSEFPLEKDNRFLEVGAGHRDGARNSENYFDLRMVPERGFSSVLLWLWIQGKNIDWSKVYPNGTFFKKPLPGYHFNRERYLPEKIDPVAPSSKSIQLHPLLHQNISDFYHQRFSSTFSGNEYFLSDHIIDGQPLLPAVVCLEMVREAVSRALGDIDGGRCMGLKNVVWVRPIALQNQPVQLDITLFAQENGEIIWQIDSRPQDHNAAHIVHCEGIAVPGSDSKVIDLDIESHKAECDRKCYTLKQCYDSFKTMGMAYGPSLQGIQKLHMGKEKVLAEIRLPAEVADSKATYVLHPALMDAALQSAIGLAGAPGFLDGPGFNDGAGSDGLSPMLPFAVDQVEIMGDLAPTMWVLTRYANGSGAGDKVEKLDIDLCDDQGRVCVMLKNLFIRKMKKQIKIHTKVGTGAGTRVADPLVEKVMLLPAWEPMAMEKRDVFPTQMDRVLIIGGTQNRQADIRQLFPKAQILKIGYVVSKTEIIDRLKIHGRIDHIIWIAPHHGLNIDDETIVTGQEKGVLQIFRLIRALLVLGYDSKDLGWTVITVQAQSMNIKESVGCTHASVHGLIGVMAKEYGRWKVRLLDMPSNGQWPMADIFALPADDQGDALLYRHQKWYGQRLIPMQRPGFGETAYRSKGVYVVIGGAGGIGRAWSEYMIRTYQARIVWIGRRKKDAAIEARLAELSALGRAPEYISADATDEKALLKACDKIKRRYLKINGLVHSAIVLQDSILANMDEQRFKAGLRAKVDVSVGMARAFGQEPLDFVLFFSSMLSYTKAAGQSNYAAGCTFLDSFALRMSQTWPCRVRVVNWGYWGGVGVVASKTYQERMARIGIRSIEPPEAMRALETLLSGPFEQMVFVKMTRSGILQNIETEALIKIYPPETGPTIHSVNHSMKPALSVCMPQAFDIVPLDGGLTKQIEKMEQCLSQLLLGQLQSLGLDTSLRNRPIEFIKKAGLSDLYTRWLKESFRILESRSLTLADPKQQDIESAWLLWDREKSSGLNNPYIKPYVELADVTMRALPQILTGKVSSTDIMFPDSSMKLLEGVYKDNPIADYFNGVLAHTAKNFINERLDEDPSAKIRIFEIGAGTGGTSAAVLDIIKPYQDNIAQYCYTDLSSAFLLHAQKAYGADNPFLDVQIFNVSEPLTDQDVDAGGYDLVIAGNVLHATPNIRQTLRNAKGLLKNNGWILLNEISSSSTFNHLTFGLLEGWWLYEDSDFRIPGCPGLFSDNWRWVLETEGFGSIRFPAQSAHDHGQQIIVAQSDGVVRLTLSPKREDVAKTEKERSDPEMALPREDAQQLIARLISSVIKVSTHKIETDVAMEKYGIDSIMVMQLTRQLEKTFGPLSKTLFFEYKTLGELTDYFIQSHGTRLTELLHIDQPSKTLEKRTDEIATLPVPSFVKKFNHSRFKSLEVKYDKQTRPLLDIAIVGLSGRYPKARNIDQFWENLRNGVDCITEIPKKRWDHALYFDEDKNKPGKIYTKWGGFIDGVDQFDPLFFNISPREAKNMDPQERLFLQIAYETLEDAGYTEGALNHKRSNCVENNVGVYVGVMYEEYQLYGAQEQILGRPKTLGGSPASIANRISYYFNFNGPSMAVDTMCSSSLTAIHLACQSISRGGCELALAGGVNISIHPNKYLMLSEGRFVSSNGRSESFGQGGDGFVPGEGVGAVLLKPLSKAMTDGDHIYGVIKSTAINHGGKTNGYTVPNPNAQANVIEQAFKQAGISPGTISYLEAHGTGTALGDPIEIAGLTRAFAQKGQKRQYCAIGSVKSNIGHCESAAGIAAVTKVLLQLKHKQIVPSLHSTTLNPNIDFTQTPFVVQQKLSSWKKPLVQVNGEEKEYSRIAGISSFGAGGANAHVVIEEHVVQAAGPVPITVSADKPVIVLLSARNQERLKVQARQLFGAVTDQKLSDCDLASIAYTLQVGRNAMEARMATVVSTVKELVEKLTRFVEGRKDIDNLYLGHVQGNNDTQGLFAGDDELQEAVQKWIERRKYHKLSKLWVKGLIVDWTKLYDDTIHTNSTKQPQPCRISLPTYPFEQERYWIPEVTSWDLQPGGGARIAQLHPLLHQNTSDFYRQRFSSTFTGKEFFLSDHVICGQLVLPAAAYLEMVTAAVIQAQGAINQDHKIRLKNVVWNRPIFVNCQPAQIHIELLAPENGEIAWQIYTRGESMGTLETVHGEGIAVLGSADPDPVPVPVLDIDRIKSECDKHRLSSDQCYEVFKTMGMDYGASHRGIETLYLGEGKAFAKLTLPTKAQDPNSCYVLHPALMDSALQSCIGLNPCLLDRVPHFADGPGDVVLRPVLPFALEQVEMFSELQPNMWALARYADGSKTNDKLQKVDIDVCDDKGHVCVRIIGFSSRIMAGHVEATGHGIGTVMFHSMWKEKAPAKQASPRKYRQHLVLFLDGQDSDSRLIKANMKTVDCFVLKAEGKDLAERFCIYAAQVFEHLQSILRSKPKHQILIQVVVVANSDQQHYRGISGMLKTAGLENPKIIGQFIEVRSGLDSKAVPDLLRQNSDDPIGHEIRYKQKKRFVAAFDEIETVKYDAPVPWKNKGVYLITGGVGGLGQLVAKEIGRKTKDATLIVTGRSKLSKEKQEQLKQIRKSGVRIEYKPVDVTQGNDVDALIREIHKEHNHINGIIHSAGVISDNFIINKSIQEFRDVLSPKVQGVVHLDHASRDQPLDFFVIFSSLAGAFGNPGQADYACANAFLDVYAGYRNDLVDAGQRKGHTLSITWPLWKNGGMQMGRDAQKMMLHRTGMTAMETKAGMRALYQAMATDQSQVMVVNGLPSHIRQAVFSREEISIPRPVKKSMAIESDVLRERVEKHLKQIVSNAIKLPSHRIESDVPLEKYGIDSVMVMQMTDQLEKTFDSISKTLFFEYQSIGELAEYFLASHGNQLTELLGIEPASNPSKAQSLDMLPVAVSDAMNTARSLRFPSFGSESGEKSDPAPDIAIVGLSGRYPKAKNIEQFWKNLRDGMDCITEIPKERWNNDLYFDQDPNKPGKIYSKWGGFIDGVDRFDSLFFNIAPRDAKIMDPQERLFLQSVHETLEDAGYTQQTLSPGNGTGIKGHVGVYVGVMYDEYSLYGAQEQIQGRPLAISAIQASIANRISYYFNFNGPSMAVNTMCSSSLTAIHLACQSIKQGECEVAVAGGVNVSIHPSKYLMLSLGKICFEQRKVREFRARWKWICSRRRGRRSAAQTVVKSHG